MSDLRDLYQEVIFDHNRNPRNFRSLILLDTMARASETLTSRARYDRPKSAQDPGNHRQLL